MGEGRDLAAQNAFSMSTICRFKTGYVYSWLFKNHWTDHICGVKWKVEAFGMHSIRFMVCDLGGDTWATHDVQGTIG